MIHRTKGTNSYLKRITYHRLVISNIKSFVFTGFLCNLELAKGRIIELKRLVFMSFVNKENKVIFF